MESPKDEHKRAEEAEEVEVGEAEGPLTQRGLTARQLFISLLLKLSYCVRHVFIDTCVSRPWEGAFYAAFLYRLMYKRLIILL